MDALAFKEKLEFEKSAHIFNEEIDEEDGRYILVSKLVGQGKEWKICDVFFDLIYVCEAYEHAINLYGVFKELYRCTKAGGRMVILDIPVEKLGQLEIDEWEQWISDSDIEKYTKECGAFRKSV